MALVGASMLMGRVGPDLIYFTKFQKKLLGSAEMSTFSLVVLSLSDQVQGAFGPSELTCTLQVIALNVWLWQCNTQVTMLLTCLQWWWQWSPVWWWWLVLLDWGCLPDSPMLNSTIHFFTMSWWDHHVFLDLLECWPLVNKVVDDFMMVQAVHFIGKHWCTTINFKAPVTTPIVNILIFQKHDFSEKIRFDISCESYGKWFTWNAMPSFLCCLLQHFKD